MATERLRGQFGWKLRSGIPKARIFASGDVLVEQANLYFDWCERHPIYKAELIKYKGDYEEAELALRRPFTMDGLAVFLGVSGAYFRTSKQQLREKIESGKGGDVERELLDAITYIESVIRNQQIEGASVGIFNGNLVARLNNLADNVNQTNAGESVVRVTVRDAATAKKLNDLDDLL